MVQKVGRNDPCPCGSGKKYKNCCLQKEQQQPGQSLGKRKFKAKILSGGGSHKPQPQPGQEQTQKAAVDYETLMERSFGQALHSHENKPPVPQNPSEYLAEDESKDSSQS
jgi:uncharacterized protein